MERGARSGSGTYAARSAARAARLAATTRELEVLQVLPAARLPEYNKYVWRRFAV
jgi:hypothetical protein